MLAPASLFISYAKANRQQWLLPVRQHLLGAQHQGVIQIWEDSRIAPGEVWDETIASALKAANIIVLLVSSAYNASNYCVHEMNQALMRQRRGEAKVVWIYVDPCDYGVMPFANLEGMPKAQDGSLVPLAGFSRNKRADHLASISKRIREIAEKIGGAEDRKFASRKYNGLSADTLNDKSIRESLEERIRDISAELNVSLALLRSVLANLVGTQVQ